MNVPDTIYGKLAPGTAGAGVGDPVGDPQTEKVAWRVTVCACCGWSRAGLAELQN